MRLGRLVKIIIGRKEKQLPLTISPVPAGIFDPNDLCNGVYNEDPELSNLAWTNRRFQAALAYVLRSSGGSLRDNSWGSVVNKAGAQGDTDLRTSTFCRIWVGSVYHDADVRNIYRTPVSVVTALFELARPGQPIPPFQPFVYEAEDPATESPIGAEMKPSPWGERRLFVALEPVSSQYKTGGVFETTEGRYVKVSYLVGGAGGSGPLGAGATLKPAWERVYSR